jgi:hypothetical protein
VIADLLFEGMHVIALDGVDDLVGFFEHEVGERSERLIAIPGTSFGRSQRTHHLYKLLELVCRARHRSIPSSRELVVPSRLRGPC